MTAQELFDQSIIELGNLKDGDIFIVKDLFKGHLWNKQDISERLTLGTLFMNFVKQNPNNIKALDKNSSGQQKYKMENSLTYKDFQRSNCFAKTGIMTLKRVGKDMIFISIGTSGFDLCETLVNSEADVEKLASLLNQTLSEWKNGKYPFDEETE